MVTVSKTDYLIFRECRKNAWLKIHRPEIFNQSPLSEFDQAIIETGNIVESEARHLFPNGTLIEGRERQAQEATQALISQKATPIFQGVFFRDGFLAATDIIRYDEPAKGYFLYEVKASNHVKEDVHLADLAFQYVLLSRMGIEPQKVHVVHFNSKFVRSGNLDVNTLFHIEDVTEEVRALLSATEKEMQSAWDYLSQENEPTGSCKCIFKGRSNHCTTFQYSNPTIPQYGVHDIARIGLSKVKLMELAANGIFRLEDVPADMEFSATQRNQIDTHIQGRVISDIAKIRGELSNLVYPLYFLDYETCPAALPRFDGFSPYQQIPFQYSLHILTEANGTPRHAEFLSVTANDPSAAFSESLQRNIGDTGSVIVWNKTFESGINKQLGERIPQTQPFLNSINSRIYDLKDVFSKQYYVHKDFHGGTSIKDVLPVLAPELSYTSLAIQEGGTASQAWDKIASEEMTPAERDKLSADLREYCKLDTYAMFVIWKFLYSLINPRPATVMDDPLANFAAHSDEEGKKKDPESPTNIERPTIDPRLPRNS